MNVRQRHDDTDRGRFLADPVHNFSVLQKLLSAAPAAGLQRKLSSGLKRSPARRHGSERRSAQDLEKPGLYDTNKAI